MEKSFDGILNALIEEYEKNPQVDVNDIAKTIAERGNLNFDGEEVAKVNDLVDSIDNSYNSLIKNKEESGVSTEAWMKMKIISAASEAGLDESDQEKALELIAEAMEKNNGETLKKID